MKIKIGFIFILGMDSSCLCDKINWDENSHAHAWLLIATFPSLNSSLSAFLIWFKWNSNSNQSFSSWDMKGWVWLQVLSNILKGKEEGTSINFFLKVHLATIFFPLASFLFYWYFPCQIPLKEERLEKKEREKGVFLLPWYSKNRPIQLHKEFTLRLQGLWPYPSKMSSRILDLSYRRGLQGASTLEAFGVNQYRPYVDTNRGRALA